MTVLDRILADTRDLVARRKRDTPRHVLEQRPAFRAPTLSLARALRPTHPTDAPAVLAEFKRASPSAGVIRSDATVTEVVRAYKAGGAAALSILTEPLHFRGSLEDLAVARLATDLPLLRKDFIVDEYQLVEARAYGADAVLLIATALDAAQLRDLHDAATGLGLTPLVELYDPAELDRVELDQVRVLGVNNRDLRTFSVDPLRAARVLEHVPSSIVRVAESGLRSPDDLAAVRRHGVDAVLIGEALMRERDAERALRRLRLGAADRLRPTLCAA